MLAINPLVNRECCAKEGGTYTKEAATCTRRCLWRGNFVFRSHLLVLTTLRVVCTCVANLIRKIRADSAFPSNEAVLALMQLTSHYDVRIYVRDREYFLLM